MHRRLIVLFFATSAISIVLASIVSSEDKTADGTELNRKTVPADKITDQVRDIMEFRQGLEIGSFLGASETEQNELFQKALTELINEEAEQDFDNSDFGIPPVEDCWESNDAELVSSLRQSADLLDKRANLLERTDSDLAADQCRNIAQLLRLEARAISDGH